MRFSIGVISDTHLSGSGIELIDPVGEIFKGVDLIVHAGDIVNRSVLDHLESIAPVEAVAGNMDPVDLQQDLPLKKILTLGTYRLGLIHGWGQPFGIRDRIRREFDKVDIIVYGHSHLPFEGWEGSVYFFNPGTTTRHPLGRTPTCGRIHLGDEIKSEIFSLD